MGLNFRKSITICKGVKLNLSKSGVSVSGGIKGARVSLNSKGQSRATLGIPGTGVYYTKTLGNIGKSKSGKTAAKSKSKASTKKEEIAKKKEELKANNNAVEEEKSKLAVEEYENYIELIRSVHKECDDPVDWHLVYRSEAPFEKGTVGELESKALKELNDYKPGFFEKMNKANVEQKRRELEAAVEAARAEDMEAYDNWQSMHDFSKGVIEGDIDSYLAVIEEAAPFDDLLEYGSDFEVGTDSPESMSVQFNVKSDTVVPKMSMSLSKTGKATQRELTKTQYYDYVQDYVCSCTIRLARDIFALLPVSTVYVHAEDGVLNTATGHMTDHTILSVKFNRKGFEDINFEMIDPSDFLCTFPHNMEFLKTSGFKEVERIED